MVSCDSFLEEKPEDTKTSDQDWQKPADAETHINSLYNSGPAQMNNMDISGGWTPKATMWNGIISGLFVDKRKDRTFTTASEGCTFTVQSYTDQAQSLWDQFYTGVSRANDVLLNVPKMTGVLSESEIANYVAQAKFFRAYAYFYLVKEFGSVPYIDKPYTSTSGMYVEPMAAVDLYKKIEADLTEAINSGSLANATFYGNKGRVTKAMAQTLLAQVYLQWAGYPVNGGNEYYTKAANAALAVIKDGKHSLEQAAGSSDDESSAFNVIKTSESSAEIIYAKEYDQTNLSSGSSYQSRAAGSDITQWKDAKGKSVFLTTVVANQYMPCDMIIDSYAPEDIRAHEKQFFFREYTDATQVSHTMNNIGNWLWFDDKAMINGVASDNNIPIMRYSEVLLIAAEALARTGHEGNQEGGAKYYLNQVRKRAGLADETATGDALIQAILTERLHELPLEFRIWDDIRRTHLYPEANGVKSGKLKWVSLANATIQNKPDGSTKVGALPEWVLLWPLPADEIQRNPALVGHQNEGWN